MVVKDVPFEMANHNCLAKAFSGFCTFTKNNQTLCLDNNGTWNGDMVILVDQFTKVPTRYFETVQLDNDANEIMEADGGKAKITSKFTLQVLAHMLQNRIVKLENVIIVMTLHIMWASVPSYAKRTRGSNADHVAVLANARRRNVKILRVL